MKINSSMYSLLLSAILSFFLLSCKKQAEVPTVTTNPLLAICTLHVTFGGEITDIGGSGVLESGICWSTSKSPTINDFKTTEGPGYGKFSTSITFTDVNTTYYLRAYATNSSGTGYGNVVSVKTQIIVATDNDGNVYHTVTIGSQIWMVENLKTTKYRNGTQIPNVTDPAAWARLQYGAYVDIKNDANYSSTYGRLYNWHAITDIGGLAPAGWHVPTEDEWITLIYFLGSYSVAGGKLKEAGTSHWLVPNTDATNETGFTALPASNAGGYDFRFEEFHYTGYYWSSTSFHEGAAIYLSFNAYSGDIGIDSYVKEMGYSIRCIKD